MSNTSEEDTAEREPVVVTTPPPMPAFDCAEPGDGSAAPGDGSGALIPAVAWMADEEVVFLRPDGTRVPGRIAVAVPHELHGHYTCAISLDGMRDDFTNRPMPMTIHGETALQSLLLAIRFMGRMLRVFLDQGGRVLYLGGEGDDDGVGDIDMPLDAFFGPLLVDRSGS